MTLREQKLRKNFFKRTAEKMLMRLSKGKDVKFEDFVVKVYNQNHPKKFLKNLEFKVFKEKVSQAFQEEKKRKDGQKALLAEANKILQPKASPDRCRANLFKGVLGSNQRIDHCYPGHGGGDRTFTWVDH